jgi:hypothetical protein
MKPHTFGLSRFVFEVAGYSVSHHCAQILQIITLGKYSIGVTDGAVPAIFGFFPHDRDDFFDALVLHGIDSLSPWPVQF